MRFVAVNRLVLNPVETSYLVKSMTPPESDLYNAISFLTALVSLIS